MMTTGQRFRCASALFVLVILLCTACGPAARESKSRQGGTAVTGRLSEDVPERIDALEQAGPQKAAGQTASPNAAPAFAERQPRRRLNRLRYETERVFGPSGTAQDWEPAMAVDPSNSNYVYQAVTRFGGTKACGTCPDPAIIFRVSSDAGATWGADQFLCPCAGTTDQDDPQLTVTNTGVVYAVWMESFVPGVSFAKSSDHGQTWTAPIHVDGGIAGGSDKPWLINSPDGQDVYIGISTGNFLVTTSHNFGASFGPLVKANTDTDYWYPEGGAVAPDGTPYFAASADGATNTQLSIVRSTNGGTTWSTQQLDTSKGGRACGGGCPSYFYNAQSSLAIDTAGTIMFAYVANTAAKANKSLYVRTSTNGVTWAPRQLINSAGDANFPQVVSTGSNDFRVAWEDNANAGSTNTWVVRTANGGGSWLNNKLVSNVAGGATYKSATGYAFPYGDYFELDASSTGRTYLVWGEGVSYTGDGGVWYTRSNK